MPKLTFSQLGVGTLQNSLVIFRVG